MGGDVFPKDSPRSLTSHAEIAVYEALRRGLPEGWTAWHSLRLRTETGWEGESDFVVADPHRGFICLEVKGGTVELRGGHWIQNGREMRHAPKDQAHHFARNLAGELHRRGIAVPPHGVACAFPDVEFSIGPDTGDLSGLVIGRRDLAWIGEVLPSILDRALAGREPPNGARWISALHSIWGETWVPRVGLLDRVEDSMQHVIALDAEQLGILDIAGDNPRAWVVGGAGTGKTIVARELCLRRARAGARVLYVCFTEALARAVDRSFESALGPARTARACAVRRFAQELLADRGLPADANASGFWEDVSLRAACDALPPGREHPDLTVVDEAQDLSDGDWTLVQSLTEKQALWIFADERQKFWLDRSIPASVTEGATRLRLLRQQRNPAAIADMAARYAGDASRAPISPDPAVLRVAVADGDPLDRVRHEISALRAQGVGPSDIVVLSLAGQTRSRVVQLDCLGSHSLRRADADDAANHIVADTFLRFKGLERPCVIIVEIGGPATKQYDLRMHVALTRATAMAIVVATQEERQADHRLQVVGR